MSPQGLPSCRGSPPILGALVSGPQTHPSENLSLPGTLTSSRRSCTSGGGPGDTAVHWQSYQHQAGHIAGVAAL